MKKTFATTADTSIAWGHWLLDNLEEQLKQGTDQGLVPDPAAMGVAHVLHGLQMAGLVGDCPPKLLSAWLRVVATSVEKGAVPPLLAWGWVETDDGYRPH